MADAERLRQLIESEGPSVKANTNVFNRGRYESVERFPAYEALKGQAREIKEDAIERLPELVDEVTATVEENGGTVYLAEDGVDAAEYVSSLVEDVDAERVVKSKSMTTEEVELNEAVEDIGVEVVETDLGEWVIQLANESPSHLAAPAIHKSRAEIAELLNDRFDLDGSLSSAEELTGFARERLAEDIKDADVGVTGANFIAADSGTILLVTSEGNARRVVSATETHVAVAGIEKIVPTVSDMHPFVELIGRSATGQDITSYISLITSPGETPVVDFEDDETPISECSSDRAFHLVLVDNGRMAMRDDEDLRETLYCIRCGACANVCANYQSVGGHAFGGETYTGGIGSGWEAGLEGLDVAAEFNDLCTGCSRCVDACPVKIDIPWINTVVRDRINRNADAPAEWLVDGLTPDVEDGVPLDKRFFGNFETVARMGSALAPVSNWIANRRVSRWAMEQMFGIHPDRSLPSFKRKTFVDWAADQDLTHPDSPYKVVIYPDLYTNHVLVDRGIATARMLHAMGVDVAVSDPRESGRAPLSQGMIETARSQATAVHTSLAPYLEDGRRVIMIEPSDLAMVTREYERFLPEPAYSMMARHTREPLSYVAGLLEDGVDTSALRSGDGQAVAYHAHCQQRTLDLEAPTVAVLETLGYDVITSDVECCGMAGSFGYKSDFYELSMTVGEELQEHFQAGPHRERQVLASGTSCLEQLDALLERTPKHPVEVIAPQ